MSFPHDDDTTPSANDDVTNAHQWPWVGPFTAELTADQLATLEAKARETATQLEQASAALQAHLDKRTMRDEAGR